MVRSPIVGARFVLVYRERTLAVPGSKVAIMIIAALIPFHRSVLNRPVSH